ncbi:DUF4232 domain-containing protein [Arthrobacter sp. Z1-15]
MRLWKSSSVSAVAIGAVLALAGCGSGGGEAASSESPSSSSSSVSPSASAPASPAASDPGTAVPTPVPTQTAAPPVPPAGAASCSAADLAGSVEENVGGGAAGSVYRTLVLTNVSAAPCAAAQGYPGVSYINAAGQPLGAAAVRSGGPVTGEPLLLEPNQSVVSELKETRAENYGEDCVSEQATQLVVYPPDDLESLNIDHQILACANPNVELLSVGPVQKR